jgi:fimbrial chaperone protein
MEFISKVIIRQTMVLISVLMLSAFASASELHVSPSKLEFMADTKSNVLSVLNDGARRFLLRVSATEWSQNVEEKNIYAETSDIIFYPKNIILEGGGQQVIRVGTKVSPLSREKTYCLIIEEIPQSNDHTLTKNEPGGKMIGFRSAIPIFIKPRKEQFSWEIKKITLAGGRVAVAVHNDGNVHITVTSVSLRGISPDGTEPFVRDIAGWHLLSGASGSYQTEIPTDVCRRLSRLDVEVKSVTTSLKSSLKVRKGMCAQ